MTPSSDFRSWVESLRDLQPAHRRPYRTYRQTFKRVLELADLRADVVTVRAFGRSVRQQPLWCVSVNHRGAAPPPVLVVANLHAMEHVGAATALALLSEAADDKSPWQKRILHVVPVANPDGFLEIENALAEGRWRFVRKNANGVDLNRNFAENWSDRYYLNRLLRPIFACGPGPLSEPETGALDRLCETQRPGIVVSLHAFGEWIYTPYAGRRQRPPDFEAMRRIATKMADRQPRKRYRVLQLARRSRLFAARGAEIDHFYSRYGAFSFLIEIGSGPSMVEPSTWFDPYRWFTPKDFRVEAQVANVLPALHVLADVVI